MASLTVTCSRETGSARKWERGYTLAAALTLLAVMSIFLALALPLWSRVKQRDNEEELIFRGKEYMRAITRYQQKFGAFPPDLETLFKQKMIRRLYADPMTKSGKWKLIHPGDLTPITGKAGQVGGYVPTAGQTQEEIEQKQKEQEAEADKEEGDEEKEVETIGPIIGVVSRSKKDSIKEYNGRAHYNEWRFVWGEQQQQQQLQQLQQQQLRQQGGRGVRTGGGQLTGGQGQSGGENKNGDDSE